MPDKEQIALMGILMRRAGFGAPYEELKPAPLKRVSKKVIIWYVGMRAETGESVAVWRDEQSGISQRPQRPRMAIVGAPVAATQAGGPAGNLPSA